MEDSQVDEWRSLDGDSKWWISDFGSIERAVSELGTPIYVFHPEEARRAYHSLVDSFEVWGDVTLAYSLKTNPFFGLLSQLRELGAWAEVVSIWEYEIALRSGFRGDQIIFNGPLKRPDELAVMRDEPPFSVNIDSIEELAHLEKAAQDIGQEIGVGVRFCPVKTGEVWSRFGLEVQTGELHQALRSIEESSWLSLKILHVHLGTQITDSEHYRDALRMAKEIWTVEDLENHVSLDIGGGFPYSHDLQPADQPFNPGRFLADLVEVWSDLPRPRLFIEPGRIIAAPAFSIVSTALACKLRQGEPSIIVLDSGTNHNVMAAFYDHLWFLQKPVTSPAPFRFCGPLCMEDDILSRDLKGYVPEVGSLVALTNAGAYSFSLSRTFIQARPPIIELSGQGSYDVLVARETLDDAYGLSAL